MNSPDQLTVLGIALVAVGLASKLRRNEESPPATLLSRAHTALQVYFHPRNSSLPPTPSPLKLQRPHSALSIDLSSLSRCSSALRLETERVNRMSSYCQALERKAQCWELRHIRQSQERQAYMEDKELREGVYQAEITYRQRQLEKEKISKEQEKAAKIHNLQDFSKAKKIQKEREMEIRQDELNRSAAKLGLSRYAKQRAEEERRRDRLEKAKEWRDFVEAKKKVEREERDSYDGGRHRELTFSLQQAVSRNQAIVSELRKCGYLQL